MRIRICAVGKAKGGPEAALAADFLSRADKAGRNLGFRGAALAECEAPPAARRADPAARKSAETKALLDQVSNPARIIALDLGGECWSSEKMAEKLAQWRDDGIGEAAFLIGGADGLDRRATAAADAVIAFGRATWPHMLVRAMAAEQIYRCMTIFAGRPYHRSGRP